MKNWVRFFGIILMVGALVFLTARSQADSFSATGTEEEAAVTEPGRVTRFLVMGVDSAAKLTDSMFVVTLREGDSTARILQIPRDTYANYTEKSYKKLNAAARQLGEAGIKEALSKALGVKLHYFVVLDLSALTAIVDAIGGVDLVVPQDMHYSDPAQGLEIELFAGPNHLDGNSAEQFVRYRAGYVNADLGRLDAQKLFLAAFAKKCASLPATALLRITALSLTKLQTDIGLPDAVRTVIQLRSCNTEEIPMATLAGQAVQGESGAWYYAVNRAGACRMINEYLLPETPLSDAEFDKQGFFDRKDHEKFHKIYLAPEGDLPIDAF